MVWFTINAEFPELRLKVGSQIESMPRDGLLHLANIHGLARPGKITRETTIGELLDILEGES